MTQKTSIAIVFLLLISYQPSTALEIWGSFESRSGLETPSDTTWWTGRNRIRLDFDSEIARNTTFRSDIVLLNYYGKSDFSLFEYMPPGVSSELDTITAFWADRYFEPAMADSVSDYLDAIRDQVFRIYMFDTIFLDNAYLSLNYSKLDFRVGLQQLPWGTGYAWNPTDLFNKKTVIDPEADKPGVPAVRADYELGSSGSLTGIFRPEERIGWSAFALRTDWSLGGFDAGFSAVERHRLTVPWGELLYPETKIDTTSFPGDTLYSAEYPDLDLRFVPSFPYFQVAGNREKERMIAMDAVGELFGLGIWAEGGYFFRESGEIYRFLLGCDYTASLLPGTDAPSTYMLFEYLYNSEGVSDPSAVDWLSYISGERLTLGSSYFFSALSHPFADLVTGWLYTVVSLDDSSLMVMPRLIVSLMDDVELEIAMTTFWGTENTEFGFMEHGGYIGLKGYF